MITVILIEPEQAGNVGAIARVMKNFGFTKLLLVDPVCDHLSEEALQRAKHAGDILRGARVSGWDALKTYNHLIGTTAALGTDYNVIRTPLSPRACAEKILGLDTVGLVFGREGIGLKNEEIRKLDFIVTIPSSPDYPTLNLSHSVAVLLYELSLALHKKTVSSHLTVMGKEEKDVLLNKIDDVLDTMEFVSPNKRETQRKVWKRVVGKSMLSKREGTALMGFFGKMKIQKKS